MTDSNFKGALRARQLFIAGCAIAALFATAAASARTPPPTINGTPPTTATVGTLYKFTPTAKEANGDAVSFSVKNKPSWASFSIASGTLSGTPATASVGTDSDIVISASSRRASASLAPFAITVAAAGSGSGAGGTGSASLHWTTPTMNTNGSALTDLAGYHLYYGTSPSSMTTSITVANAGTTSYTVGNLPAGTWYFAVNAYTTSGLDSALSNTDSEPVP
jgi:hypothetical protein